MQKQIEMQKHIQMQKQNTTHSTNSEQPELYQKGIPAASLTNTTECKNKTPFSGTFGQQDPERRGLPGASSDWW